MISANAVGRHEPRLFLSLCVYDRLMRAPVSMGARLLVVKAILSIIYFCFSFLTELSLSLRTLCFSRCHPPVQAHSWGCSDPGPGPAFCQIIGRCCGRPLFRYTLLLQCVSVSVGRSVLSDAVTRVFTASRSSPPPWVSRGTGIPSMTTHPPCH